MAVRILGMGDFDEVDLMIENVQVDIKPESQVRISCRSTENLGGCALQTFQRGDRGECVKRIQRAVREFTATVRPAVRPAPEPERFTDADVEQYDFFASQSQTVANTNRDRLLKEATSGYGSGNKVTPNTKATGTSVGKPNSLSYNETGTLVNTSVPSFSSFDRDADETLVNTSVPSFSSFDRGPALQVSQVTEPKPLPARTVNRLLSIDGVYGRNTETAVKQFQTKVGLPSTGIVDRATWEAIERKA